MPNDGTRNKLADQISVTLAALKMIKIEDKDIAELILEAEQSLRAARVLVLKKETTR